MTSAGAAGWHGAALVAGAATYIAASRGWLGWRVSSRVRSVMLAAGVALFGGGVLQYIVSGVRADGVVTFALLWAVVVLAAVALTRGIRTRWPTFGLAFLAVGPAAALVPGFPAALARVAVPVAIIGVLGWLLLRILRPANR